jgi:DNA anti-recombination protein RmuC
VKIKDTGETQVGRTYKKTKSQIPPPLFYILTEGDMEIIGQQMDDTAEEIWEKATKKQDAHQKKIKDQLIELQQMMDATRSRMQHKAEEEAVEEFTKKQEVIQKQLGVIQKILKSLQLTPTQGLGTGQTCLTKVTHTAGLV